ncbi:General stress protein 69 [Anatilimnocola aggregata]|uniref:General stress protein 69 n=1 Tax=Anatilimnocola aggregata TaxID=2528021 RepID=A0A517YH01_9BACT|nr:aldo/keto reductase [Anatilimnocola aggregata]QDU29520.1 General stress protein 69 [Anatilimnocola aggregata]
MPAPLRPLGNSGLLVSPVALGCWPIAGMTSLGVNDADSRATIHAALDAGINFLDTAYIYGTDGQSEKLIGETIAGNRDKLVIATKGGIHWDANGDRAFDGSRATLHRECRESLRRLKIDVIDLYYLHAPDPNLPIEESAAGIAELQAAGMIRAAAVSNVSVDQLRRFQAVCPVDAVQPAYNMLQRQIEADLVPYCREQNIGICIYWPLLKGLLAGKLARDHVFEAGDGRAKYPMFQGQEWQRNQDLLDDLHAIARDAGKTVPQLVVQWTIAQPGITSALCGAKRPDQILESAAALQDEITPEQLARIAAALDKRGPAITRSAV